MQYPVLDLDHEPDPDTVIPKSSGSEDFRVHNRAFQWQRGVRRKIKPYFLCFEVKEWRKQLSQIKLKADFCDVKKYFERKA